MTLILYNAAICVYWEKSNIFTVSENITDAEQFKSATLNDFHNSLDTSDIR